ncbi:MAG: C40 family peptidase [Gammaproteobacteria bacterium]|nr:C40 family peptidase [Gammaproteobacteria bacterium]
MKIHRICVCATRVKAEPRAQAETVTEGLFGEAVEVLGHSTDWAHVRLLRDGYKGYILERSLAQSDTPTTHLVTNASTWVFEKPDIKSTTLQRLILGSELALVADDGDGSFLQLKGGGYLWRGHVAPVLRVDKRPLSELALSYYHNTPYLWGGRSVDGCDCSGLVQQLCQLKGLQVPRDSGEQEPVVGEPVPSPERTAEDLVFWPGHVGVLKSPDVLVHATAHYLKVCAEPLNAVIDRAGEPRSVKRLTWRT